MSTARDRMGPSAVGSVAALASGGNTHPPATAVATTEEWAVPLVTKTVGTD